MPAPAHPDDLIQHTARTLLLRAPYRDWPALMQGTKREFRTPSMGAIGDILQTPTPIVLYAVSPSMLRRNRREGLAVLLEHRSERLIDLAHDHEGLEREGFASYNEFRAYWRSRTHRPFRASQEVEVFRVAPWGAVAEDDLGVALLRRLYGAYLDNGRDGRDQ